MIYNGVHMYLAQSAVTGGFDPRHQRQAGAERALRAALDPGDHCGPWGQEERQAQACPRAARGAQNPAVAGVREHPNQQGTDELASGTHKEENLRYRSQTLESVKHHLKPNRQRSVGPRHLKGH